LEIFSGFIIACLLFLQPIKPTHEKMKISAAEVLILAIGTLIRCKKNNDKKPDCKIAHLVRRHQLPQYIVV